MTHEKERLDRIVRVHIDAFVDWYNDTQADPYVGVVPFYAVEEWLKDHFDPTRTPSPELPEVLNRFHLTSVIDTAHYNKEISDDLHDRLIKAVRDTSPELPEGVKMVDVEGLKRSISKVMQGAIGYAGHDAVNTIRDTVLIEIDKATLTDDEGGRDERE